MKKSLKSFSVFLCCMMFFLMISPFLPAKVVKAVSMRKVVDSSHPLMVLQLKIGPNASVGDSDFKRDYAGWSIKRVWASIPDDVKPYVVFVLHPGHGSPITTAQSRQWMQDTFAEGKDLNIPMMALFGEQPTSGSDGMSWIESMYATYPNFIGTAVSELTSTISSVPSLLALANKYGGYHLQSHQDQNDLFEAQMEKSSYYNSVKQYSSNFIYAPKTMHNNFQYNTSEALGYWLAGVAGNWGGYWDSWQYGEAVSSPFGESSRHAGQTSEQATPESLWAMSMYDDYMQGATVFCPENTILPSYNGELTPAFYNSFLQAFRYIIANPISKSTVASNIKVAYSASEGAMASLPDTDGTVRTTFFDGLYATQQDPTTSSTLLYNLRTTGRYYTIPQIPMLADSSILAQFPNVLKKSTYTSLFKTHTDKLNYFNNINQLNYSGDAFAQNLGNQWLVYNSNYGANYNQSAYIPLTAGTNFNEIDFPDMPFGTHAMINDGNTLSITLNNYMSNNLADGVFTGGETWQEYINSFQEYSYDCNPQDSDLRTTTMKVTSKIGKPSLTISGYDKHYNYTENWNDSTNVYTLTINHNGPVNIRLEPADTDSSYWTRIDDNNSDLVYDQDWTHDTGISSDYKSTYSYASTTGSAVSFNFEGTSIDWFDNKGPSGGNADIYIDNVLWASNISTFSDKASYGQLIFKKSGLSNGAHNIKIVNKSGTIGVDRFSYIPQQVQSLKDITYNDFTYGTADEDQGIMQGTDYWTIRNGNMKILPLTGPFNGQVPVYYTGATYSDFSYSADVNSTKGDPVSLLFRANPTLSTYYNLELDPLSLNLNKDTTTEQLKLYKGTTLIGKYALPSSINTFYNLKVVATGSTIQCYVNDTLYITATDTSYTSGNIGVASVMSSNKGGEILVDNVSVTVGGNSVYLSDFNSWNAATNWKVGGATIFPVRSTTSFNFPYQWTTSNGAWSVVNNNDLHTSGENGVYSGTANSGVLSTALAGPNTWSNYQYKAAMKYKTGSVYDASMAFRAVDKSNMYMFSLNGSTNTATLYKMVDGVKTALKSTSYTVTPEKWYLLGVQTDGQFIECSVDGTTCLKAQDDTFSSGQVGFTTYNGTSAQFDDAWITQLQLDPNTRVPASSINVTSAGGIDAISTNNGTLQMSAIITPSNATRSDVSWSVVEPDGVTATTKAAVDASGMLNALQDGKVMVIASINDDSKGAKVIGTKLITISGQTSNLGICGIEPIYIKNEKDTVSLPNQVKVNYIDGTTGNANVVWDAVTPTQSGVAVTPYISGQTRGKYVVGGTVAGTKIRAYAHVTVVPKITSGIAISATVTAGTQYAFPLYLKNVTFNAGGGTAAFRTNCNVLWDNFVDTTGLKSGSVVTVTGTIQGYEYQKASVKITIT